MSCAEIMTKDPFAIGSHEDVAVAAEKLVAQRILSAPVLDGNDRYIGMFGIHALLCQLVPRVALAGNVLPNLRFIAEDPGALRNNFQTLKRRTAGEVADRDAPTLAPDSPEIDAVRLFCQNHNVLAVIEPETRKVVGVVSCWDAIGAIAGQ